jgi:soluble lytic murein transglycosylase-like protein
MFSYTPPPAIEQCISAAADQYQVPAADILRSIELTQQNPQRFSIGIMGIPIAYESIFPLYGFDNYQVETDDCTNIKAGAMAISFDLHAGAVQSQENDWAAYRVPETLRARAKEFLGLLTEASRAYTVPVALLEAIITQESGFKPNALSPKGAVGLMQLMPQTASGLGVNPYNVSENISGGAYLIKSLLIKYSGNLSLALAAYNAGSQNVARYNGIPPFPETQQYVPSVEGLYQKYQQQNR